MKNLDSQVNRIIDIPPIQTQFLSQAEFGVISKGCQNYGLCSLVPLNYNIEVKVNTVKQATALVTVFTTDYVEFDFLRNSMTDPTYEKFFKSGQFIVEECFKYADLGMDCTFRISQGKYRVTNHRSILKVIFDTRWQQHVGS